MDFLKTFKLYLATYLNFDFLYKNDSFSQEGEDLIISKLTKDITKGFYLDIGAYHPFRLSNTYLLYKKGWRGINVDASSVSEKLFKKARPDDLFINSALSDKTEKLTYFEFEEQALNTFSKKRADEIIKSGQSKVSNKKIIKTKTLNHIFAKIDKTVDFLNIDIEGLELKVLRNFNFRKYKPTIIAIENFEDRHKVDKLLKDYKYTKVAQTILTGIYKLVP